MFECINFYLNSEILVDYKSGHSRRLKFYNSDDEENLEDYYSKQPNGDIKKNLAKPGRFYMVQTFNTDSESDPDDLESNEWRAITILKSYHVRLKNLNYFIKNAEKKCSESIIKKKQI